MKLKNTLFLLTALLTLAFSSANNQLTQPTMNKDFEIIYLDKNIQLNTLTGVKIDDSYSFSFNESHIIVALIYCGKSITSEQLKPIEQYYSNGFPFNATCIKGTFFSPPNRVLTITPKNCINHNLPAHTQQQQENTEIQEQTQNDSSNSSELYLHHQEYLSNLPTVSLRIQLNSLDIFDNSIPEISVTYIKDSTPILYPIPTEIYFDPSTYDEYLIAKVPQDPGISFNSPVRYIYNEVELQQLFIKNNFDDKLFNFTPE